MAGQREAHELLLIEEADAWFEYLEATRAQSALRYKEVEPWAWARLTQRLRAIKTSRAKLRPAAEPRRRRAAIDGWQRVATERMRPATLHVREGP